MKELKQFTANLEKLITGFEDDSACRKKLSQALKKKNYKSKLNDGFEYHCEELISKRYSFWELEQQLRFTTAIMHEFLAGLISERLQAESAVILSEGISRTVNDLLSWDIGRENDFMSIHRWLDVIEEIDSTTTSAPCRLNHIKSLRSTSKKRDELIRLWRFLFKCRKVGSKFENSVSKSEAVDIFKDFSISYPEIADVYGFSELLDSIESSIKQSDEALLNEPIRKQIAVVSKVISGRAKVMICRTSLGNRTKAEAWLKDIYETQKRIDGRYRARTREEILLDSLKKNEETEFQSILKSLFEVLLDQRLQLDNKQELINAIRIIYRAQNIPPGVPPWYPELLEEPYYPNADLTKCAHFLFVLGSLEQGNLSGRWEEESLQYLLKNQTQEGYWSTSTFNLRPDNDTTVATIHALALWKPKGWDVAIKKGAEWLWKRQLPDGSWTSFPFNRYIILDAIDLAESKNKYAIKLSEEAIETSFETESYEEKLKQDNINNDVFFSEGLMNTSTFDEATIKENFSFRPGQVLFGGKDLAIKTGMAQDVLKKLVADFSFIVTFKELDSQSSDYEASVALRGLISYLNKKLKGLPVKIDNRRQSGYLMRLAD